MPWAQFQLKGCLCFQRIMFQFGDWLCRDWVQSKGESEGCGTFGFRISYAFLSCCLNWFLLIDHARAHHPRSLPPTNVTHSPNQEQMFMLQVLWFLPPPLRPTLTLTMMPGKYMKGGCGRKHRNACLLRARVVLLQPDITHWVYLSLQRQWVFIQNKWEVYTAVYTEEFW